MEQTKPTRTLRPPVAVPAISLRLRKHEGVEFTLVDVREPGAFHARHVAGSINAPDSHTTALVKKMQSLESAILVCEDGRTSAMVARTLGCCGFKEIAFLEGGLQAWAKAGGKLMETTRSGFEHELEPEPSTPIDEARTGSLRSWLGHLFSMR